MEVNELIEEANEVAGKYNLKLVEIDRTDNIISLKLLIDNELFIQIYGKRPLQKYGLCHPELVSGSCWSKESHAEPSSA